MSEMQPHSESHQSKPIEQSLSAAEATQTSNPLFHHHAQPTPKSWLIQFLTNFDRSSVEDDRPLSPTAWQTSVSRAAVIVIGMIEWLRPVTVRVQTWAKTGLVMIRRCLPESWAARMGDRLLVSSIIVLLLIGGGIGWIGIPQDLTKPAVNSSRVTAPTVSSPPVPLQLTPEPSLIASIQAEVGAVVDRYSEGHIQSIQANFRNSQLTVIIDGWNDFSLTRQEQLAADLWERSQALQFQQLVLISPEGTQLARSPVVGTRMVLTNSD